MKKKNKLYWKIMIPILVVLFIGALFYIVPKMSMFPSFGQWDLQDLFNQKPNKDCTFTIDDDEVCVGDNVTGIIKARDYNNCYIAFNYNNEGWRFAGIIDAIRAGYFEESRQAEVIGHYEFAAICGTPSDFCRTNNAEVDVIPCDDDGIEYTCGWVGEQCDGTCPTTHPLCVDMWYDPVLRGGYSFCACIDPDTETVHPDWKPDGQYHDDSEGDICDVLCGDEYDGGRKVNSFGDCNDDESPIGVGDTLCCCLNKDTPLPEYPTDEDCEDWCIDTKGYGSGAGLYHYTEDCFGDYETLFLSEKCCCWDIPIAVPPEDCKWDCIKTGYEDGYGYSGSCGTGETVVGSCCCITQQVCKSLCALNPGGDFQAIVPYTGDNQACSIFSQLFCKHYNYRTAGSGYDIMANCCCFACY